MRKLFSIICAILICIPVLSGCRPSIGGQRPTEPSQPSVQEIAYDTAIALLAQEDYEVAYDKFLECDGYRDADSYLACFTYKRDSHTQQSTYHRDGITTKSETRIEYTYDRHGNPLLEIRYFDGASAERIAYQYDADGNTTHYIVYDSDGSLLSSQIMEHNDHGHNTIWTYYTSFPDITQINTYTYEYDEDGNILSRKTFGKSNNLIQHQTWCYDEYGNVTFYTRTDSTGKLQQKDTYKFTYDENGWIIHEERYIINGDLHSTRDITYDENGNILSEIAYYGSGMLMKHAIYTYDEYGFVTSETEYDIDGNIIMHKEYEYEGATLYFNPNLK